MLDTFDSLHGTETAAIRRLWWKRILSGRKSECSRYQAIDPLWFNEAIRNVPKWPFIDLGSGKGRPLILAAEAGFTNLTGVEFSESLCRVARENLKRCKIQANLVCDDARNFTFPNEPCVVFMYNPFGPAIMQKVLANLSNAPRFVVYVTPKHHALFEGFTLVKDLGHSHVYANYLKAKIPPMPVVAVDSVAVGV